jgi:hypothetical protein
MYSPGKALVVYEINKHVCCGERCYRRIRLAYLADGTVARDNALEESERRIAAAEPVP